MNTVASFVKPNEGSIATLHSLSASRTPWVPVAKINEWLETASAADVAEKINWLETQPKPRQESCANEGAGSVHTKDIPAGRYAIDSLNSPGQTRFYKVDRPTEGRWAGYTFVKVQAGDELHNIRNRDQRAAILAQIAKDGIEKAMLRYGRELGQCGHCGRTLTNEESRAVGIGPVCRAKMGF